MATISQQTLLLPEIDDQETAARVRAFFDRDMSRLLNRAGRPISDLTRAMVTREFLRTVDYTELRRIELVMRDLMKEKTNG